MRSTVRDRCRPRTRSRSPSASIAVTLQPQKDYQSEQVLRACCRWPRHALLLDEIALQPGQMGDKAVRNVKALQTLIAAQLMEIDFKYYTHEFPVDIPVAVVSEGRSFLPVRCSVLSLRFKDLILSLCVNNFRVTAFLLSLFDFFAVPRTVGL